jgi:hypothetical protein
MGMNPRLLRPLASGFNPRSIAGLNLWVDFSDESPGNVTLDGSTNISNVKDKSDSGFNGGQTTSGDRPGVSTLNGLRCANWGTSSNTLSLFYAHGSAALNFQSAFLAAVWDGGGSTFPANVGILSAFNETPLWICRENTANLEASGTPWKRQRLNNTFGDFPGGGAGLVAFPTITSTFVSESGSVTPVSVNGWRIGGDRGFAGRGWRGRIGEVLMFSRVLSDPESLRVRRYLATKWGAPAQT